jgi:uncharacterized membrane protein
MLNAMVFRLRLLKLKSVPQIFVLAAMVKISQQIGVVFGPIKLPSYEVKDAASGALVPGLKMYKLIKYKY